MMFAAAPAMPRALNSAVLTDEDALLWRAGCSFSWLKVFPTGELNMFHAKICGMECPDGF